MNHKYDNTIFCESCSVLMAVEQPCNFCKANITTSELSEKTFSEQSLKYHPSIGYYDKCFSSISENYQQSSTAGGFTTEFLSEVLKKKIVSTVVSVQFDEASKLFKYEKFYKFSELYKQQRSVYVPVSISGLVSKIEKIKGRVCIVAIPSVVKHIKTSELLRKKFQKDEIIMIGLVSGGYKEPRYINYLVEKSGNTFPGEYSEISFRDKRKNFPYNGQNYFFRMTCDDADIELRSGDIPYNWQYGLLKFLPSDFCDDTFNICADITVMDAWLPEFEQSFGATLLICRKKEFTAFIEQNYLFKAKEISSEKIVSSQSGGLRHKTTGLSARVFLMRCLGKKLPERFDKLEHSFSLIQLIDQSIRMLASYSTRKNFQKIGDAMKMERKLNKYVFLLRCINFLKRKFTSYYG